MPAGRQGEMTSGTVVFRAILPTKKIPTDWKEKILAQMKNIGNEMQKDLEAVSRTWEGDKPDWEVGTSVESYGLRLVIHPKDESSPGSQKFMWLDRGTKVRHALMSKDFGAKTQVRSLSSVAGSGGLLFVSRKINRPGIKARYFTRTLAVKWRQKYLQTVQDSLNETFGVG